MPSESYGPFDPAAGEQTVTLGFNRNYQWQEITVSIEDENGSPVTSGVTGSLAGQVTKQGADQREDFAQGLDLAAGDRSWTAEQSLVNAFHFTPAGMVATHRYVISINSWGDV